MDIRNAITQPLEIRPSAERLAAGLTAPGRLGHFQLLEEMGAGGMGRVFRALDARLDRVVALKVLANSDGVPATRGTRGADRLMREARLAARVNHPSVVAVHEAGEVAGLPFLVQEYVAGAPLRDLLDAQGTLAVPDTIAIIRGIAEALQAVHAAGVIHRDVKPDNVLCGADGRVRLTDFGVAREDTPSAAAREAGLFLGTPEYAAPEQCVSDDIDARADLYALGVTAYELLTGTVPHEGESAIEILSLVATITPRRLDAIDPTIPAALADVVAKLLARKRYERYGSAAEVIADLDAVAAMPAVAARVRGQRPAPTTRRQARTATPTRATVRADRPVTQRRGLTSDTPRRRVIGWWQRSLAATVAACMVGVTAALLGAVGTAVALLRAASADAAPPAEATPAPAPADGEKTARLAPSPIATVDAAGGATAASIGRALDRALADLEDDAPIASGAVITVREFPATASVVVEFSRDGRLAGRLQYSLHRGIVARAVADVTDWLRAGLSAGAVPAAPLS